jgi:hypothetical protein
VSGVYCQDVDANLVCGESTEPRIHFCATVTITSPSDWDTSLDVVIFPDGLLNGNAFVSPCGVDSWAASGLVSHS